MTDNLLIPLVRELVDQLGWGDIATWSGKDFTRLTEIIHEKTGVLLSESTLRRVTGRAPSSHLPSDTTLDALARFLGYTDLRAFRQSRQPVAKTATIPGPTPSRRIYWLLPLLALIALAAWFFVKRKPRPGPSSIAQFHLRSLTNSLPNTVLFDYTVDSIDTSALFLQQSWDPSTRVAISPKEHTVSSLYYRPGYFLAKLIQGKNILRETPLLIRTKGWTGLIDHGTKPLQYLDSAEFIHPDGLRVEPSSYSSRLLRPDLSLMRAELYNVGNSRPVLASSVHLTVAIKGCSHSVACAHLSVFLLTDGVPISLSLADTGCVAGVSIMNGWTKVDGAKHDLSGLGTRLQQWNLVDIQSADQHLIIRVNGREAYRGPVPPHAMKVLGLGFGFNGDGAVKDLQLSDSAGLAFKLAR